MVNLVRQNDILHLIDWYQTEYCEVETYFEEFRRDIESWTAVDAVPVVRCKDCKFYTVRNYIEKSGICTLATRHLGDDGYCSEGERKRGQ